MFCSFHVCVVNVCFDSYAVIVSVRPFVRRGLALILSVLGGAAATMLKNRGALQDVRRSLSFVFRSPSLSLCLSVFPLFFPLCHICQRCHALFPFCSLISSPFIVHSRSQVDQLSIFRSIAKWSTTVKRVKDIVPSLREAFAQAQTGVPGPVFVELPIDVLYPIEPVFAEYVGKQQPKVCHN